MEIILKYFSDFSGLQLQQFADLFELYKEWNTKINVISRKDIDSFYLNHVLHSLAIAAAIEFAPGSRVIDIGTGGGFPGVPLAVFFPEVEFHLVDSIAKKLKVLNAVVQAIKLTNVTTAHTRVEEIKNRQFDFAVSRAVAPVKDLLRWSFPLLKKGTKQGLANGLICLKGGDLVHEIEESGANPRMLPISDFFEEDYFKEKYLLHFSR